MKLRSNATNAAQQRASSISWLAERLLSQRRLVTDRTGGIFVSAGFGEKNEPRIMRAVGLISLLLAIVLGIAAVRSYVDDSRKRDKALNQILFLLADSALRSSSLEEIARFDANMRNDEILGAIAAVFLMASLSMLSRSAVARHNSLRHGVSHKSRS